MPYSNQNGKICRESKLCTRSTVNSAGSIRELGTYRTYIRVLAFPPFYPLNVNCNNRAVAVSNLRPNVSVAN